MLANLLAADDVLLSALFEGMVLEAEDICGRQGNRGAWLIGPEGEIHLVISHSTGCQDFYGVDMLTAVDELGVIPAWKTTEYYSELQQQDVKVPTLWFTRPPNGLNPAQKRALLRIKAECGIEQLFVTDI